jgi:hypothetical protein
MSEELRYTHPLAILKIPYEITEEEAEELKRRFMESNPRHRTMFIPPGVDTVAFRDQYFSDADIENLVAHHPPSSPEIIAAHEELRAMFKDLMVRMNHLLPEGALKVLALRATHAALQAANTCVAVEQDVFRSEPLTSSCAICQHAIIKDVAPRSEWKHQHGYEGAEHEAKPSMI